MASPGHETPTTTVEADAKGGAGTNGVQAATARLFGMASALGNRRMTQILQRRIDPATQTWLT